MLTRAEQKDRRKKPGSQRCWAFLLATGFLAQGLKGELMANHFTPEELAAELGTGTRDVIQLCVKEGIPIYKGKIDRSLLTAVMRTKGIQLPRTEVATA